MFLNPLEESRYQWALGEDNDKMKFLLTDPTDKSYLLGWDLGPRASIFSLQAYRSPGVEKVFMNYF